MMKAKTIRSSWFDGFGYRLDCQPYLAGALEAKIVLERLRFRKDPLQTLTAGPGGGIYQGPQFRRVFVDSLKFGGPFVGSSAMLRGDLVNLPLLSRQEAYSPR